MISITLTGPDIALAGLAAFAAGIVNALAGGGTLISFPTLIAIGIPDVAANITNTVALCPGYVGGTLAQKKDLARQGRRLLLLVPAGIAGGIAGAVLLLAVSPEVFAVLVPFLILFASLLLAVQDRVRARIRQHAGKEDRLAGCRRHGSRGTGRGSGRRAVCRTDRSCLSPVDGCLDRYYRGDCPPAPVVTGGPVPGMTR
jgi:uncharacterized membrane protein YfcA